MLRTNVYLTEEQRDFLRDFNKLKLAEHIRRAIDDYINKLRSNKASGSLSTIGEVKIKNKDYFKRLKGLEKGGKK